MKQENTKFHTELFGLIRNMKKAQSVALGGFCLLLGPGGVWEGFSSAVQDLLNVHVHGQK